MADLAESDGRSPASDEQPDRGRRDDAGGAGAASEIHEEAAAARQGASDRSLPETRKLPSLHQVLRRPDLLRELQRQGCFVLRRRAAAPPLAGVNEAANA